MMTNAKTTVCSTALLLLLAAACGSGEDDDAPAKGAGGSAGTGAAGGTGGAGGTGATGGSGGKGGSGGTGASGGKGGTSGTSGSGPAAGSSGSATVVVPGEPCDSVDSALPPKPCMVNVNVKVSGGAADIQFEPVDGAVDYRVYELPDEDDVTADGEHLTIKNATYRCAGTRQSPPVPADGAEQLPGGAMKTYVDGQDVAGYKRALDEATLGYVSVVPGDDLVPVYALGDPGADADNSCFFMRWKETRVKEYVNTDDARDQLLKKAYRDDGIVFYVPKGDGADTRPVYTSTLDYGRFYFVDGPEADMRQGASQAFSVFSEPADGLVPLMRVYFQNGCGRTHDELLAGKARFERARNEGDTSPMNVLHWSGLTGSTTLVVEALADGCPNVPGVLSAESRPSRQNAFDSTLPAYISVDDARALSDDGELYINGQFDEQNRPRPIARSFVKVKPAEAPDLEWFEGFDGELGSVSDVPCGNPINCYKEYRDSSDSGDLHYISVEDDRYLASPIMGELWVTYSDEAADTPGKFRFTPNAKGTMAKDSYFYVTMEVNAFTTARRYPQILISDQDSPVQHNMPNGKTVVIQPFGDWPYIYQLEVCDHRYWDVNNQCPTVDLYRYFEPGSTDKVKSLAPNAEVGDETGVDSSTKFEVWISSQRAYLYLNSQPYGCVELPEGAPQEGPVTVTYGDTLYHSGVDTLDFYDYVRTEFRLDTSRHYDNLGFKSGVAAPPWDESRLPCVTGFID